MAGKCLAMRAHVCTDRLHREGMHSVPFVLDRPAGSLMLRQAEVEAALARVLADRRVEHVRVHASRAGARGVIFLVAPSLSAACALCDDWLAAVGREPLLRGWSGRVLATSPD